MQRIKIKATSANGGTAIINRAPNGRAWVALPNGIGAQATYAGIAHRNQDVFLPELREARDAKEAIGICRTMAYPGWTYTEMEG